MFYNIVCQLDGISALARGCRLLSRIDLEEVTLITDHSVHALAAHCPNLTTLTLSHCEFDRVNSIVPHADDLIWFR
jgi:F-box/leucine-rich repeat protein 2/20